MVNAIENPDITQLDPRSLLAFVAVFEEGSVTAAAKRIGLTQQGLSGVLARLRGQFGDILFVRVPHGVTPTPRAESLYPKVIYALESLQNILQERVFDPATVTATFRIATSDYALSVLVRPLFQHLKELAPNIQLSIVPLQVEVLQGQMRKGQVDLALTVPEFVPDNLYTKTLFSDHYLCALRKDHPQANQPISLDTFCNLEHLLVAPNGHDLQSPTDRLLAKLGRRRKVGLAVPGFLVAESLLLATDLVAILPARLLRGRAVSLFTTAPPVDIPAFDIVCAWPDRVHNDPVSIWFREILRLLVGDR